MFVCPLSIQGHWQTCGRAFASHTSLCCRCWHWSDRSDWDDRNEGWCWLSARRSGPWSDSHTNAFVSSSCCHYKRHRRWKRRNISIWAARASRAAPTGATMRCRSGVRPIRPSEACTRPQAFSITLWSMVFVNSCICRYMDIHGVTFGGTWQIRKTPDSIYSNYLILIALCSEKIGWYWGRMHRPSECTSLPLWQCRSWQVSRK